MQCLFLGGIESNKYGIQCMFENSILPIKTNIFLWIKETKGELTKNLKLVNGLTKLQYHFTVCIFSFSSLISVVTFYHLQLSKQVLTESCNIFSPDGGIWKGYWDLWTGLHFDKYLTVYQQCASKVFIRPYKPNCTIWKLIYQIYTQTLRFRYSLFICRVLMVQL